MTEEIFTQLGNLLQLLFPDIEIVQRWQNRTPMPVGPFINMGALRQARLATNETTYNGVDEKTLTNFKRFDVQIDFYGPNMGDSANTFETVFRDEYAVAKMGPLVTPLYCTDAMQAPITNEEKQYEERWIVTASVEFNPDVALPQDSMDIAEVTPVNVEATYP